MLRYTAHFVLVASSLAACAAPARAACCYFAAKDKDVNQPAQKAFITWDEAEKVESFTVQPKFEGNAQAGPAQAGRDAPRLLQRTRGVHHPRADGPDQVQADEALLRQGHGRVG